MTSYASIELGAPTIRSPSNNKLVVALASCVFGVIAGLSIVSVTSDSLYTASATRAVQTPVFAVSSRVGRQQSNLYAVNSAPSSESFPAVVHTPENNSLIFPVVLASSVAALAFSVVKMLSAPKVAMLTTTAVKREWVAQSGKKYKGVQPIIAPSLLAADLANLAADAKRVMDAGADVLHVDVMDGHFVPNLSWGAPVIKCLRQHSNAFFDTHLMVSNPEDFIAPMADAGVDQFTFHIEAAKDPKALIKAIKDAGMKVGISVKPKTPIDEVFPYVEDVDLILVMTVEPGFGGQSFMEDMMPKVKTLREKYPNLEIQVDGGLGPKTIDAAAKAGANAIVAGSACFVADPKSAIDAMRDSLEKHLTGPGM